MSAFRARRISTRFAVRKLLMPLIFAALAIPSVSAGNGHLASAQGEAWQTYEHPFKLTEACLRDVSIVTSDNVWAVGCDGIAAHYNGSAWSLVSTPTQNDLQAVAMTSATDGWAVGVEGTILHYDGTDWSVATSPTQQHLNDVAVIASNDAWAVGGLNTGEGVILHWDGAEWDTFASPTTRGLRSIHMLSATEGWIAGSTGVGIPRTILRWDGTQWALAGGDSTINSVLYAVHMSSSTRGWAVGETIGDAWVLRYQDGNWSPWGDGRLPHKREAYDVYSISEDDAWIVGENGFIYRFDGTDWYVFDRHPGGTALHAIDFLGNEGWAVGNLGTIMYFDGQTWTTVHEALPTEGYIMGVDMFTQTDAWAVGFVGHLWFYYPGGNFILHYDGSMWQGVGYGPDVSTLYGVDMVSTTEGWAVGGGIMHYEGSTWSTVVEADSYPTLYAVEMIDQLSGWAVGGDGTILRYTDGGGWEQVTSPTALPLFGLDCVSPNSCWAIGTGSVGGYEQSVVLHCDGASWSLQDILVGPELRDIDAISDDDVWAVGYDGSIFHYDGQDWAFAGSPTTEDLRTVKMLEADDGWVVGRSGVILHYNGSVWSSTDSSTLADLYDIDFVSAQDEPFGWAVGKDLVFKGSPSPGFMVYLPLVLRGYP